MIVIFWRWNRCVAFTHHVTRAVGRAVTRDVRVVLLLGQPVVCNVLDSQIRVPALAPEAAVGAGDQRLLGERHQRPCGHLDGALDRARCREGPAASWNGKTTIHG